MPDYAAIANQVRSESKPDYAALANDTRAESNQPESPRGFWETMLHAPDEVLQGIGSGVVRTGLGAYNLARKLPQLPGATPLPDPPAALVNAAQAPNSIAGKIGQFGEQAAEFALPVGEAGKLITAAPEAASLGTKALAALSRIGLKSGAAGGTAFVQSGGDPVAAGLTAATEGGLGTLGSGVPAGAKLAVQKLLDASPRPLSEAAMAMAAKYGIPLSRGTAGGSKIVRATEKLLGHSVAPDLYESQFEEAQQGLNTAAHDMAGNFATDQYQAGDSVVKKVLAYAADKAKIGGDSYDEMANIEGLPENQRTIVTGMKPSPSGIVDDSGRPTQVPITQTIGIPVSTQPVKEALQPIRDQIMQQLPVGRQQYSVGLHAIQNILDGPDVLPASVADQNLSALKQIQREAISPKVKFLVSKAIDGYSKAVDTAVADAGPDAAATLAKARDAWKAKSQALDFVDQLSGDRTGKTGQVDAVKALFRPADASYPLLQNVLQVAPEARQDLANGYLSRVFKQASDDGQFTNIKSASNLFNQIGKRTQAALFPPQQLNDIKTVFELAKRVNENPNPSESGMMVMLIKAGMMITHPVQGAATIGFGRKLAQVLYQPEGAAALRDALGSSGNPGKLRQAMAVVKSIADKSAENLAPPTQTAAPGIPQVQQ